MKDLNQTPNSRIKHLHFIGIGGSGMSGIAEVLFNLGYQISGSDIASTPLIKRLKKIGIVIFEQHHKDNILNAQAVVVSSAIDEKNPEIIQAKLNNIPIVPRAEMLAEIMRFRFGIAVAGTHGKTTTTSIITHILNTANLDPTYIIGGILNASGFGAKLGKSKYLIAEADESDGSFLRLKPMLSVITNIDQDHMSTYDNDAKKLDTAFINFTSNLPFYGACVMCLDDIGVVRVLPNIHRPVITYGTHQNADIRADSISQKSQKMLFKVACKKHQLNFPVTLNLIGRHNILNALAAIGICLELDINIQIIQQALLNFKGVARRLDYHGVLNIAGNPVTVFDDYGHHPSEIKAVFSSLKDTYPHKKLVVIFQPHRYSRTRDLFDEFVATLSDADELILLDIYPANESPIAHITASSLAHSIRKRCVLDPVVVQKVDDIFAVLLNIISPNDLLLTLGAGDIHTLAQQLKNAYQT
jgi:UDP-N-acetylmuramate--alanine ligase